MVDGSQRPHALPRGDVNAVRVALEGADAILVADYGRGMTHGTDLRELLRAAASLVPMVWDPHPDSGAPVPGVAVATPNHHEARAFAPDLAGSSLAGDIARAGRLVADWQVRHVAVTRGEEGVVLMSGPAGVPLVVPARRITHADASGAGDHFAVATTAGLAAGNLVSEAITSAVAATSEHLAGESTSASERFPVAAGEPVDELVRRVRAGGGRVVAAGGCFDLLHVGHVTMLGNARQLGDCLIVLLNSDRSTRALKGPSRPVVPEQDRARMLQALTCVDGVVIFDEPSPAAVIERLRPDLFVKGADYGLDAILERDVVERVGGQVVVVPYLSGRSTTSMIHEVGQGTVP